MTKPDNDAVFMRQALDLAGQGIGRTSPNPMVGSVVVRDGVVARDHEVVLLNTGGALKYLDVVEEG